MAEEYLDIYSPQGERIGTALRSECHGNPALLHHTAHVVVVHPQSGAVLLQRRSPHKRIQPGKWDTAVGGHLECGEDFLAGAQRELREELGISEAVTLTPLFADKIRNEIESEDVMVYGVKLAGPFKFQASEIDEVRFWNAAELADPENRKHFTPNLISELETLKTIPSWYPLLSFHETRK